MFLDFKISTTTTKKNEKKNKKIEYIFDNSAASLRVKIDYKIIECDTFIFSDNFKDWFLDLIFDV